MRKKILLIFFVLVIVYPSFGGVDLWFRSSLNSHSNDIYKSLYGTLSYGWGIGVGASPYEGVTITGMYNEDKDKGFLSFTKEDISLSVSSISMDIRLEPLTIFQNDYIFHLSPYLSIEPSYNFYKENSVINSNSGSKFAIGFGGGINVDIKGKNRFFIGIKYKNLKTFSKIHNQDINISGLCFEAGLKIAIFN
jgi:hypothetical protein